MTTQQGGTKRLNANVPRDLHQAFQVACIHKNEDMTTVLINFLTAYVTQANKQKDTKL